MDTNYSLKQTRMERLNSLKRQYDHWIELSKHVVDDATDYLILMHASECLKSIVILEQELIE